MIEKLISAGHAPADVWRYTPRRIAGFCAYLDRRQKAEAADALALAFNAAHGKPDEIKRQIKEMRGK